MGYNIAMVCDFFHPNLGGVENHIYSLAQMLLDRHKVLVITHGYGDRKGVRYLSNYLKVYYCPIASIASNASMPCFTASLPLLRTILIREKIQIVHAHQATSTLSSEAIQYASILGLRTVYTDHSLFALDDLAGVILNRVLQLTLSSCHAAICVSNVCRDNFLLRTKVCDTKVHVIPNAVSPEQFVPASAPPSMDRIKVVVVSRLVFRKGIDLLVGMIPIVCRKLDYVDFIIGGDGNKLLDLQEMVEHYRLQDRVEFLGSIPHRSVRDVLVRGHVFLNCSLTESFCIAILEASCCGLLVVSTNVGGVPEVLPDDLILLADPKLPCLVERLEQAIERQRREPLDPQSTHQRMRGMYSWRRVAVETESVYDTIMKQPVLSFGERMNGYKSLGFISGYVGCWLAMLVQFWFHYVEWWQPRHTIDVVPDLTPVRSNWRRGPS